MVWCGFPFCCNETRMGFVVMILASIVGIIFAVDPPQLIAVMVGWVSGAMLSAFGFPLVLGLWWKRANTAGALAGMVGGTVTFIIMAILPFALVSEHLVSAPVSAILTIGVSLLTQAPSKDTQLQVDHYHTNVQV